MMNITKRTLVFIMVFVIASGSGFFANGQILDKITPESELNANVLTVATRHDITIQNLYEAAFLATPEATALGITKIDFREASSDSAWKKLLEDPTKGVDVGWGGGPPLFNTMDRWGLLKHITDVDFLDFLNTSVLDRIAGAEMKFKDESDNIIWIANAISSFGFTVNHDFLDTHGLAVPSTWEELASPAYYLSSGVKAVSMGDPPLTTSNTRIYHIILQAFGWETGWSILTRMAANSGIYTGSVDTRAAVVNGEVGIAMTIDFYGIIANNENPSCEYIIPEGQSIVNGDPIAMAIHVDNEEEAEAFIRYVLSDDGQALWLTEGINRLPVREEAFQTPFGQTKTELYAMYNQTLANIGIEFNETLATDYLSTTIHYFHNTITQEHNRLRNAWGEMVTQLESGEINASVFQDYVTQLGTVNMTEAQAIEWNTEYQSDPLFASEKDSIWRDFGQKKYVAIYNELAGITDDGPFSIVSATVALFVITLGVLVYNKKWKNK